MVSPQASLSSMRQQHYWQLHVPELVMDICKGGCCVRPGSPGHAAEAAARCRLSMEEQATQFWDEIRRNQAAVPQVDPHDIEACEALLESYYMQVLPLMPYMNPWDLWQA